MRSRGWCSTQKSGWPRAKKIRAGAAALTIFLATTLSLGQTGAGAELDRPDHKVLELGVQKVVADHGAPIRVGLWLGRATGEPLYRSNPDLVFPTASAIKTAFLIELFAKHAGALDRSPPELTDILADDHPAVSHFTPAQRTEIREGLKGASIRQIGGMMMGSIPVSNLVYNAAANVTTALLGGPEGLTRAIQARDPAFAPITVRRYMLADRRVRGDNEATPAALAAVLQRLAARQVPGLDSATVDEIRRAVIAKDEPGRGRHYHKDGDLSTDPLTRVNSGWFEAKGRTIVYTVMSAQTDPGKRPRDEAFRQLDATANTLTETLIQSLQDPGPHPRTP